MSCLNRTSTAFLKEGSHQVGSLIGPDPRGDLESVGGVFEGKEVGPLTDLTQGEWPVVFAYLSSLIVGYLYALLAWNLRSPFAFTHRFDDWVADFGVRWRSRAHQKTHSKIVDFRTGKAVKDDARFMDEMLDKIAKHGEKSLTRKELRRMNKVGKRRD